MGSLDVRKVSATEGSIRELSSTNVTVQETVMCQELTLREFTGTIYDNDMETVTLTMEDLKRMKDIVEKYEALQEQVDRLESFVKSTDKTKIE
jgi:hypothetical protein